MDTVQASSFITPSKIEVLLDKIADLGGSHRAELLRSNIVKFNTTKSANENIFYSISEINLAIENNKKVSFEYFDFNSKNERVYRRNGKRYFVLDVRRQTASGWSERSGGEDSRVYSLVYARI